jgi:hypothetical protein
MKIRCFPHLTVLSSFLFFPLAVVAQKKPGEAVSLEKAELVGAAKPGAEVTARLRFKIEKGYHTHSNKPSEPNFIATVLTVPSAPGVKAGTVVYPKGKAEKVAGLDKPLSLYEEHFEITVPLQLDSSVRLPVTIPASLRYQACQGAVCFPPRTLKFDLPVAAQ